MTDDVVAELDEWLEITSGEPDAQWLAERPMIQRARDEIERLRKLTDGDWVWQQITDTRDAALEEAAHECDEEAKGSGGEVAFRDGCETCAAAIRLLKDKPCLGG